MPLVRHCLVKAHIYYGLYNTEVNIFVVLFYFFVPSCLLEIASWRDYKLIKSIIFGSHLKSNQSVWVIADPLAVEIVAAAM